MTRSLRPAVLVTALLALVAATGCVLAAGQTWQTVLPPFQEDRPGLPVALDDRTALVTGIAPLPQAGPIDFDEGVSNLPGRPDILVIAWTTGMCTERAAMVFQPSGRGFSLDVTSVETVGACRLAAIRRTLAVSLSTPIDAQVVELSQQ